MNLVLQHEASNGPDVGRKSGRDLQPDSRVLPEILLTCQVQLGCGACCSDALLMRFVGAHRARCGSQGTLRQRRAQ